MRIKRITTDNINDFSEPVTREVSGGISGNLVSYTNFFGSYTKEIELIDAYRAIAENPYVAEAMTDIINEFWVSNDDGGVPVTVNVDETDFSENIRKQIIEEFANVLRVCDFKSKGYFYIRQWYIDGREYFLCNVDANGITEVVMLNSRAIQKVKDEKTGEVFFVYEPLIDEKEKLMTLGANPFKHKGKEIVKIPTELMAYCYSGLFDKTHAVPISYLNQVIKPANQLTSIEDSIVIYRLARAPERRVFYVDIGEMSTTKAEQYMKKLMNGVKNKVSYDTTTGETREDTKQLTALDDYWLPRRSDGRATEVQTLQGGQNLGELYDVNYFLRKLYRSMNTPASRYSDEGSTFAFGRASEINRDEIKFTKFVNRLRVQYNEILKRLLKLHLVAKKIITADEFDENYNEFIFEYEIDAMYSDFKKIDLFNERVNLLNNIGENIGRLFSREYVMTEYFDFSKEDWEEMIKQIEKEKAVFGDPDEEDFGNGGGGFDNDDEPEEKPEPKEPVEKKPDEGEDEET